MITTPWSRSTSEILEELSVQVDTGLSPEDVETRLLEHGPNRLEATGHKSRWGILLKQFKSPVIYVLLAAAAIAFGLEEVLDGWAILAIVLLNTLVGSLQESRAEASIEALAALTAPRAKVMRAGKISEVPSADIIPGDLLVLESGDYVPADARIFVAHQLSAQEAVLTGESLPVEKSTQAVWPEASLADRKNMLFAGTAVSTGTCRAIVTATGKHTELGKIAQLMASSEAPQTPLQMRLEIVGRKLL